MGEQLFGRTSKSTLWGSGGGVLGAGKYQSLYYVVVVFSFWVSFAFPLQESWRETNSNVKRSID